MNADYPIIPHPYPINDPEGLDRVCSPNEWPRRTKSEWFEVARIDSNGVSNSYLFSKANYQSFKQLMAKHDAEFNTWMAGAQ